MGNSFCSETTGFHACWFRCLCSLCSLAYFQGRWRKTARVRISEAVVKSQSYRAWSCCSEFFPWVSHLSSTQTLYSQGCGKISDLPACCREWTCSPHNEMVSHCFRCVCSVHLESPNRSKQISTGSVAFDGSYRSSQESELTTNQSIFLSLLCHSNY